MNINFYSYKMWFPEFNPLILFYEILLKTAQDYGQEEKVITHGKLASELTGK